MTTVPDRPEHVNPERVCNHCDNPALPGRAVCPEHAERRAGNQRPRRRGRATEAVRQASKRWRDEHRDKGLCVHCNRKAVEGRSACQNCIARVKRQQRERAGVGLCIHCSREAMPGRARCEVCSKRANDHLRQLIARRKEQGLCLSCGKSPAYRKRSRCQPCLRYMADLAVERRKVRVEKGVCIICGKGPPLERQVKCRLCWLRGMAYQHFRTAKYAETLAHLFEESNGVCPYSGLPITLGRDAELDHRVPLSRGGANDPSNVQWVHCVVNQMKFHYPEDEFLAMVARIFRHSVLSATAL